MNLLYFCVLALALSQSAFAVEPAQEMDPAAHPVANDDRAFQPDPNSGGRIYRPDEQLDIYGGKHQMSEPYYPLLFGRRMYGIGPLGEGFNVFGSRNLAFPRLMAYGDWRNATTFSQNAKTETGEANTRLNLDIDLNLTATERVHAFTRPFDRNGLFTGCTFGADHDRNCKLKSDFNLDALFFEGDLGNIAAGITGKPNHVDLPVAAGLMPFVLHNGIWVSDIFKGAAFTIPAMNSAALGISNLDATFFYGFQDVNTPVQKATRDNDVSIWGTNLFAEFGGGYAELGYGFTDDRSGNDGDYHSVALSYTRRWQDISSWSGRVIGNFGQKPGKLDNKITANGMLLLLETSWMTSKPYTFVPYANFFGGFNQPQGLAKDTPILQNTGILFEPDGITGFPTLEGSANDTYGGALGVEYLFNLDQQIVFEMATEQVIDGDFRANRNEKTPEYGLGARYQIPLTKALIFRTDGIFDVRTQQKNEYGFRTELRLKF